jgi:hypothetical protein
MDKQTLLARIVDAFELHSPEEIKACFKLGIDPNRFYRDRPLIYDLISEYPRGPKFKECIKVFIDHGVQFDDPVLLAVLADDSILLDKLLKDDPRAIFNEYSFPCAFTPIYKASLLHICAEYNHVSCAKILVTHGIDVNIRAGVDEYGFGGHTAIFHTVNQNQNKCIEMMHYLISEGADLQLTVKGLIWGKGYEWETFIPAVNPISYAMMGLLRQFQRNEQDIYEVVSTLMKAAYGTNYSPPNIPNRYLHP